VDKDFRSAAVLERAVQLAHEALRLDPNLPQAHAQMGMLLTCKHQHEASIVEFEKAIALNANYTDWRFIMALECAGERARAIQVGQAHMRLDPFYLPVALLWVGFAYYGLGRYAESLRSARECVARAQKFRRGHCLLAATFAQLGHIEEAREEVAEILRIEPQYTISITRALALVKDREPYLDGLRMAGLPE
jgi:adenylate cyclase